MTVTIGVSEERRDGRSPSAKLSSGLFVGCWVLVDLAHNPGFKTPLKKLNWAPGTNYSLKLLSDILMLPVFVNQF